MRRTRGPSSDARLLASSLFSAGVSRADVARRVGIAKSTASEWFTRWRLDRSIPAAKRGPRLRLSPSHARRLSAALLHSPRAAGFDLPRWSLAAIVAWMERELGVRYHPRHVTRVLRAIGWSPPPIGRSASAARYSRALLDLDGNEIRLEWRARARA